MRLPPPLVAVSIAFMMYLVNPYFVACCSLSWLPHFAIIFIISAAFFLPPALLQFRRVKTTVNPYTPKKTSKLVTGGVYKYSRNPMYLGMALVLAAWAAILETAPSFAGVLVFIAYISYFQINDEEEALAELFGEEFDAYKSRVRRWL